MYFMAASAPPCSCASVIANSANVLYPNAAEAPSATSVSIFGEPRNSALYPLMKNLWFIIITTAVSSSWISPIATWFPSRNRGSGNPHIMCPIEKYISIKRNTSDHISRVRMLRNEFCVFSAGLSAGFAEPFSLAPYPAAVTAEIISSVVARNL